VSKDPTYLVGAAIARHGMAAINSAKISVGARLNNDSKFPVRSTEEI
jgi:hypothetical protein